MSKQLFIQDALLLYRKNHYVTSLSLICCVIDACAKEKHPDLKNGERIKRWIDDNITTISKHGLPATFGSGCKFDFGKNIHYTYGGKKHLIGDNGVGGLEDVLYHLIRCSIVHETVISEYIKLTTQGGFSNGIDKILLPTEIILGLIKAAEEHISKYKA